MGKSAAGGSTRLASVDMVKGWAILGVTLIHSQAMDGTLWMPLLFSHAVPVFLVLFGLNSETWFRRHAPARRTRNWYLRSFKRIAVPVYASVVVWWVIIGVMRPPEPMVLITAGLPLRHAIFWLDQIGTSWFVTLILQLVLLFPLFHWASRRLGSTGLFVLCFFLTMPTLMFTHWLRGKLGIGGWLFFPPRFFVHVAFGMLLADRVGRLGTRSILVAVALLVPLLVIQQKLWLPGWWRFADRFVELPMSVALLWTMGRLDDLPLLERPLSWLGRHSLGLYLGQMLTHNAFLYRFGGACNLYGCAGGIFEKFNLWAYTGVLLAGSIAFVFVGNAALRWYEALRQRGHRLPDLSV